MRVAVALVHYPIKDRKQNVVATNITNLDVHDIARASTVYGIEKYFIVHPLQDQRAFVSRMLEHWKIGEGAKMNPMRKTALQQVEPVESIEAALIEWRKPDGSEYSKPPLVVTTHARELEGVPAIGFKGLRELIEQADEDDRLLLVFGTGFGLTDEFMRSFNYLLEPIRGRPPGDYRHLSVRSAVSIILDRLLGAW